MRSNVTKSVYGDGAAMAAPKREKTAAMVGSLKYMFV